MVIEDLKDYLGFGVAGNFANHLKEAGEADEFAVIETKEENAPKGLFPFYIKDSNNFLGTYPIGNEYLVTHNKENLNLQVEPEVALICDFIYDEGKIKDIIPRYFSAFNDCSIRVQDGNKLSTKKNWGVNTKGISKEFIKIDNFTDKGNLSKYNISSFLKRNDRLYEYGITSSVKSYSYFFGKLRNWIIETFNTQKDNGPLEELDQFLKNAMNAKGFLIAVGATGYTEFGKNIFLQKGDEVFVYVYNAHIHSFMDIIDDIKSNSNKILKECSKLHQKIK